MATSSITSNIVISDSKTAEAFIEALEVSVRSANKPKSIPSTVEVITLNKEDVIFLNENDCNENATDI